MRKRTIFAFAVVFVCLPLVADEGMWMPQQIPQMGEKLQSRGLEIDPASLADLTGFPMGAVVSTGGCSASFVSPMGLIVTNHHCVWGYLQFNSSEEHDYMRNGFFAESMEDEVQASPGARVYVTTGIEDVTERVLGRIKKNISDLDRSKLIETRGKELVAECEKPGGLRCSVDAYFGGSQYLRTTRMEIRDVRLVYAPAEAVGNYGDEIDNWMWPRHTGDFGFIRAYVSPDGKPADFSKENVPYQPRHFLEVSTGDLDPGDLVIVAGYPGRTYRYETAAETRMKIEFAFPTSIRYRKAILSILEKENERGRDVQIANGSRISGYANYLKKYEGTLEAFQARKLAAVRAGEEERMRATGGTGFAAAMDELDSLFSRQRQTMERDSVVSWLYSMSPMLSQADTLYELSRQRVKKDIDRDVDYQERNWSRINSQISRYQRVIEPGSDRAGLKFILGEAAKLPEGQRIAAVDRVLEGTGKSGVDDQIDAFLDDLYANTKIGEEEFRLDLFDDSTKQILDRGDSMIGFAVALRPLQDEIEAREKEETGVLARLRPVYIQALKALRGGLLAPDANGTLRVTFGEVVGYEPRDAVAYEPFTTVQGLIEKESGEDPFASPGKLLDLVSKNAFGPYADPDLGTLSIDFLSTTDITNGNSGSACLNAKGELIGLAFDGNYEAMGSDYVVIPELSRTIAVDVRYVLWVMDAVDGAHRLLEEMGLPVHFGAPAEH